MIKYAKLVLHVPLMEDSFKKAIGALFDNGYELAYNSDFCTNIVNKQHNI